MTAPAHARLPLPLLAVDPGSKRVGLAVASLLGIATPLGFLHAEPKADLLKKIAAVAKDRECKGIVVGLPINMDGTEGPAAKSARAFGAELAAATGLPVDFCDERLTSFAAEKKIGEMNLTRAKRKSRVDAVAAAGILEAYLSEKRSSESPSNRR